MATVIQNNMYRQKKETLKVRLYNVSNAKFETEKQINFNKGFKWVLILKVNIFLPSDDVHIQIIYILKWRVFY